MFTVTDAKKGSCPLCLADKEKDVFVVQSEGYSGDICPPHLSALVKSSNGKVRKPEPKADRFSPDREQEE